MNLPLEISVIVNALVKIPGVGYKMAVKMGYFLALNKNNISSDIVNILEDCKKKLTVCKVCGNIANINQGLCKICKDGSRDKSVLIIVEDPIILASFETLGSFDGMYHVLGGLVSPMDGITPDTLNIANLIDRLKVDSEIKELIFGINASLEAEATIMYIRAKFAENGIMVKMSKLATGIPAGSEIEHLSTKTLLESLNFRTEIS